MFIFSKDMPLNTNQIANIAFSSMEMAKTEEGYVDSFLYQCGVAALIVAELFPEVAEMDFSGQTALDICDWVLENRPEFFEDSKFNKAYELFNITEFEYDYNIYVNGAAAGIKSAFGIFGNESLGNMTELLSKSDSWGLNNIVPEGEKE